LVEIKIRDESDSEDERASAKISDDLMDLYFKDEEAEQAEEASGSEAQGDTGSAWDEAIKLADEAATSAVLPADEELPILNLDDAVQSAWPPGSKKGWPPPREPDPFKESAAVHEIATEGDEEIPYEESSDAGVIHGGSLDRDEFAKLQLELTKLHEELRDAKAEAKQNLEMAQRKHAELINFKNRTKTDVEVQKKRAIEDLLRDLMPVMDSLEKAVFSVAPEDRDSPIVDGVKRTLGLFLNILSKYNVEVVSQCLVPFNPELHTPLVMVDTNDFEDGTVLEVYQSGYILGGKLIRPAMVKISRCIEGEAEGAEAGAASQEMQEIASAESRESEAAGQNSEEA
jgi:molecular chaperone GrpE